MPGATQSVEGAGIEAGADVVEHQRSDFGNEFAEALGEMALERPGAVWIAIVQHAAVEQVKIHPVGKPEPELRTGGKPFEDPGQIVPTVGVEQQVVVKGVITHRLVVIAVDVKCALGIPDGKPESAVGTGGPLPRNREVIFRPVPHRAISVEQVIVRHVINVHLVGDRPPIRRDGQIAVQGREKLVKGHAVAVHPVPTVVDVPRGIAVVMLLKEWFADAFGEVEHALVNRIHIHRAKEPARARVPQVDPQSPDEFVRDERIVIVVLAGAQPKVLELVDGIIREQDIVEGIGAVVAVEMDVERRFLKRIPGIPRGIGRHILQGVAWTLIVAAAHAEADVIPHWGLVGGIIAPRGRRIGNGWRVRKGSRRPRHCCSPKECRLARCCHRSARLPMIHPRWP